jgi:hypothetical protein
MSAAKITKDWDTARLAPRIHSIRQIALQYEGIEERIISRVPDVSTSGMFINTGRKYAEGAVLNLSFCLALSGLEVHARGEVRYSILSNVKSSFRAALGARPTSSSIAS